MGTVTLDMEGEIAWLTLDRPEALNAFDQKMIDAMLARLNELVTHGTARAVILTGKGRSFSTGVDLRALGDRDSTEQWFRSWAKVLATLQQLDLPLVIAACGDCIGSGLQLLLTGDYRIAGDDLRAGISSIKYGLVPGAIAYQLEATVGAMAARRLCLFDEKIDAPEALRIGLVDRVAPASRVAQIARAAADRVAKFPREAVRETKRLLAKASAIDLARFERNHLEAQQRPATPRVIVQPKPLPSVQPPAMPNRR
ncbi:MAG: enoyl-CoA hydratase/isomerase family protein [Candidatus Binataceae bacterium]